MYQVSIMFIPYNLKIINYRNLKSNKDMFKDL